VSEQLRVIYQKLTEKGIGSAVAGGVKIIDDAVFENVAVYHKYLGMLRQVRSGVIPAVVGVVGVLGNIPYTEESLAVGIADLLKGAYDALVAKKPFAYAKDSTTIKVFGLDANENITVIIDGSAISFTTPPKTDGYGNAEITLPSALSSGRHDLIAKTTKKAVYAIIVV
jgi:hypothetical protein